MIKLPCNLFYVLAISIMTVLFVMLWDSPPVTFRHAAEDKKQAPYPQTYLTGVETTQYTEDGAISYTFKADKLSYYQRNPNRKHPSDYTLIDAPLITMYDADKTPWHIRAKHGRSNASGTEIRLWGDVLAWQERDKGERSELSTSLLVLKPESQYAETNKPVMISTADSVTRAVGLQAFLQERRIKLLSRVRAVHEAI